MEAALLISVTGRGEHIPGEEQPIRVFFVDEVVHVCNRDTLDDRECGA